MKAIIAAVRAMMQVDAGVDVFIHTREESESLVAEAVGNNGLEKATLKQSALIYINHGLSSDNYQYFKQHADM